ncbi:MAG: galactokinase [Bacteroidota bacterium]
MRQLFARVFGAEQASRARLVEAPGRVNLIGEHTDYNDGFVFPIAINFAIRLMGAVRDDDIVHAYSADFGEGVRFSLASIAPDPDHSWSNYLRGVLRGLLEAGHRLRGMDVLVTGDVPQGAGLSSSAAFEVATAFLAQELFGLDLPALDMIRLCQRAENVFVGLNCGIMDQFVSRLGRAGNALLLDCRNLSYSYYPLDSNQASVVVVNSGVKHALVATEYNQRRCECETGVEVLKRYDRNIEALRDANQAMLQAHLDELGPVVGRRCRHVVEENARTLAAGEALVAGDLIRFGELMYDSHASLRDLYEVSCAELDLLVELARKTSGTLGARMTGGGFGGCTVNLVRPDKVADFRASVAAGYKDATGRSPEIYVCTAAPGARAVS